MKCFILLIKLLKFYEIITFVIDNIGTIFEYAKENFRNDENYKKIKEITDIVKNNFNK